MRLQQVFQFHKGTIKTARRPSAEETFLYFNSIKVRLKPSVSRQGAMQNIISIP